MSNCIYVPSSDYSVAIAIVYPTSPTTHYDKVAEYPTPDNGTTYVGTGGAAYQYDLYGLTLSSGSAGSGTINKVTIYVCCYGGIASSYAETYLRTHNQNYASSPITVSVGSYTTYYIDYTTNPNTGVAWTWAEISALLAGVGLITQAKNTINCTQVYVSVDYTASSPADVSDTPSTYDFGVLNASSSAATGLTNFTITNNSVFAINITIGGTDMTGGNTWTLADDGNAGNMIVAIKAGLSGGSYNIIVKKTAPFNTLKASLAGSGTQQWGMTLYAPTVFTDGVQKTGTITLTAVAA